ncbi:MAG: hypothetical protein LBB24_00640, partial [Rickettsiales bacterium]|nr:hypothetical protein [Rickettsiales bacterium]
MKKCIWFFFLAGLFMLSASRDRVNALPKGRDSGGGGSWPGNNTSAEGYGFGNCDSGGGGGGSWSDGRLIYRRMIETLLRGHGNGGGGGSWPGNNTSAEGYG